MRKILSVYAAIAILFLLIASQETSIVSANPWFASKQIDPPSGAIPPTVSINSPQNRATSLGAFNISFSVKGIEYSDFFSDIADVTYTIDNQSTHHPP